MDANASSSCSLYEKALACFEKGELADGEYLMEQAAQQDYSPALYTMGNIAYNNDDTHKALHFYVRAANLGHIEAYKPLREIFKRGDYSIRTYVAEHAAPTVYKEVSTLKRRFDQLDEPSNIIEKILHIISKIRYYEPAFLGGCGLGYIGYRLGMEYCPHYYILPAVLCLTGAIFGFLIFRGAKARYK